MSATSEPPTGATDDVAAGARRVVRIWIRERRRFLAIVTIITLGVCVTCTWFAVSTSHWRSDVMRTGREAVGTVTKVRHQTSKGGGDDELRIAVGADPPFTFRAVTPHLRYGLGDRVDVRYDPSNRRHVGIVGYPAGNDWWTIVAAIVAVCAGLGVGLSLLGWWYLMLVVVLQRSLLETHASVSARLPRGRGLHRRVLTFADTGTVPWSTTLHESAVHEGRTFVAGRRLWRVVWFPTEDRPFVLRRPRTPLGSWLWRRSARDRP